MARACAAQGATVLLHYNESEKEACELASQLESHGSRTPLFQADLTQPDACERLFAQCLDSTGRVDAVINNASIFPQDTLMEITEDSLTQNLRIHTLAPYRLAVAMQATNQEGSIVNMLDTRVADYDAQHVSYHLSKRMLHDLTRLLAMELAPAIRVNAIAPGLILPPEGEESAYLETLAHTNPLDAYGDPEDIARAALFLLESSFVTGQILYVDGGRHMKGKFYG